MGSLTARHSPKIGKSPRYTQFMHVTFQVFVGHFETFYSVTLTSVCQLVFPLCPLTTVDRNNDDKVKKALRFSFKSVIRSFQVNTS